MEAVFASLSRAVEGAPLIALSAAFAWGLLSVLLSPCHLASIPLIVGFMSEQKGMTVGRAFRTALLFSLGVLASIALIGAITAALGQMLGNVGGWVNYLVAAVFFVMGLHLLDVIPLPLGGPAGMPTARRGYLAALVIGFVYGVALGPCTFAYMAPVLAVAFKAGASAPFFAAGLFTAFGLGPLHGDHRGRHLGPAGAGVPAVERGLPGDADRAARLRRARARRRALFPVHGPVSRIATMLTRCAAVVAVVPARDVSGPHGCGCARKVVRRLIHEPWLPIRSMGLCAARPACSSNRAPRRQSGRRFPTS